MRTASKLAAALAVFFCCLSGFGQAAPISGQAVDQNGAPIPFAQVRVCSVTSSGTPCSPTAPIYLDYNLTIPSPNPVIADQYGNYTVYAPALPAPNLYVVELSPVSGVTWTYVENGPYCSIDGCTFLGPITAPYYNATEFPYYEINGVQISSSALSDAANLAYINKANVFTMNQSMPSITGMTTPLPQSEGGTGTASGTGYAYGHGTSGFTYSTTIPYSSITGTPTSLPCTAGVCILSNPPGNQVILQPAGTGLTIADATTPTMVTFANAGGWGFFGPGGFTIQDSNFALNGGDFTYSGGSNFDINSGNFLDNASASQFNSATTFTEAVNITTLGDNECVQTGTGGLLTTISTPCAVVPVTQKTEINTITSCSYPDDGANEACTNTVTMGTAMADTSYTVSCSEYTNPAMGTVVLNNTGVPTIISTTQYSFAVRTQGSSAEWTAYPNYGKSFVCTAYHP